MTVTDNTGKIGDYSFFSTASELKALIARWEEKGTLSVAMDFEEESNLHVYGEHLCIIQLFDGSSYYILDALALAKSSEGLSAMKAFLEGPI